MTKNIYIYSWDIAERRLERKKKKNKVIYLINWKLDFILLSILRV